MHGMHGMMRVKHLKIYEFVLCVDSNSRHTITRRFYDLGTDTKDFVRHDTEDK